MSRNEDGKSTVTALDAWFQDRCDGIWEHRFGITIETTDNPGWLLTFKELRIDQNALADVIGSLLRQYGAQVATDGTMVRVYSTSLANCLSAAASLINLG